MHFALGAKSEDTPPDINRKNVAEMYISSLGVLFANDFLLAQERR
jgi:hypothetical protein